MEMTLTFFSFAKFISELRLDEQALAKNKAVLKLAVLTKTMLKVPCACCGLSFVRLLCSDRSHYHRDSAGGEQRERD
jgi:hypothetical protein